MRRGRLQDGDVPDGWTLAHWIEELERKAAACEAINPHIAEGYRLWAKRLRLESSERSCSSD